MPYLPTVQAQHTTTCTIAKHCYWTALEMIVANILQVPLSENNNRYVQVLPNYFTKWTDAIPLPNSS